MPPTLVHLPQSPWSEKARWALDHHGVTYKAVEHLPMLFEPVLRVWSRDLRKKPTVPMLFDAGDVYRDSLEIATYAEKKGHGSRLFPKDREAEVYAWNDRAEQILYNGRARLMGRFVGNREALREAIPAPFSKLGGAMMPVAKLAAQFVASKYDTQSLTPAATEAAMASALEQADEKLASGVDYLVGGEFTFADIALACALGMIQPHARQPLGPASREMWTEPKLAASFPALIAWRDRIVERHR